MLFNSYVFVFLFLPLVLAGYYTLNHWGKYQIAKVFLICMSLWFYAYYNHTYLVLLLGSVLVNFLFHRLLSRHRHKGLLAAGVALNLLVLGYFKYFNFFIDNVNQLFSTDIYVKKILLPLGISFFTFQQISFLADTYLQEVRKVSFIDYTLFVSFFPQLVAGPIVTHAQMLPQLADPASKKWDSDRMIRGIKLFTYGLAKKLILADTFGKAVTWGFTYIDYVDSTNALLIALCYSFQLLLDFSGYCDMAKGLGWMLGFSLPSNFNCPFQATGIRDFWKRWHMTLSSFFTKYVFIPLGGSRRGKLRTCVNSMIVFFLSGLWHGASWTFVLWGVMHGIGYVFDYLTKDLFARVPRLLKQAVTFVFVCFAFLIFRAETVPAMMGMLGAMFSGKFGEIGIFPFFQLDEIMLPMKFLHLDSLPYAAYYPMAFFFLVTGYLVFVGKNAEQRVTESKNSVFSAIGTSLLLLYCILSMGGVNTFLYFNF